MNINISNYGAWFLDYHEGNLNAERVAELFLFLEQHPELKNEFESFSLITIPLPDAIAFPGKENLKKSGIDSSNINDWLVAESEGDLDLQSRIKLNAFIKLNPQYERDRELFSLSRLQPVKEIYPHKNALKIRMVRPYVQFIRTFAAAAVLIFMLGILYINQYGTEEQTAVLENEQLNNTSVDVVVKHDQPGSEETLDKSEVEVNNIPAISSQQFADAKPVIKKKIRRNTIDHKEVREIEQIAFAERKDIASIQSASPEAEPVAYAPVYVRNFNEPDPMFAESGINKAFNDIKDAAASKVNKATGEEILYSQQEIASADTEKIPLKSRLLKFVAWGVAKVSGEKVIMQPTFDPSGNLASYQVSAGKFKYERDF